MGYATKSKLPLSKIAIIDDEAIEAIAEKLPSGPNAPSGDLTLEDVKADSDISDALNKRHSNANDHAPGSDNQDLSGYALTGHTHSGVYEPSNSNIQNHINSAHAPSNAVSLSTVKTDTDIADAISKKHSNSNDHAPGSDNQDLSGLNPKRLFANLTAPVASSGTTEKVLLQLMIPAGRAVVGSTFRTWIVGNSSSTGTLIFRIKCGANGTISDTEDWKSVTSAAQVANQRAGFECLITIRSATTIAVDGIGYAGTVQLPTTIAAPATPAIAIANNWYINATVVCSSGTFTAQVGSIEEVR